MLVAAVGTESENSPPSGQLVLLNGPVGLAGTVVFAAQHEPAEQLELELVDMAFAAAAAVGAEFGTVRGSELRV